MTEPAQEPDDGLPKEGDLLAGKYRVERVLGQGGMGVVVAAQHLTLRQTVAVKLLLPEAMERHDSVERFLREGRAAVSIQSEHIARVLDVGTLDSGQPFMVMEYLVGSDLGDLLKSSGRLAIPDAVDYLLQACEAIAEAHMLGIVHRDLKPANIFVTRRADGSALVKVLDFGLSKVTKADSLEPSLTSANTVMGSPYYMSPEQVRSLKSIDARADIWALGVILYQLICGHRPFEEESLGALFVMIGAEQPAPITTYLPDIPRDLEAILYRCLEKAPANRFQTVAELARALAPFASDGARLSIERILRTLSDHTPLARRPLDSIPDMERPSSPSMPLAAGASQPPMAPPPGMVGTPRDVRPSGPGEAQQGFRPSAPPGAVASAMSGARTFDPDAKPPSHESMPAMSSSLAGPAIEEAARTGRRPRENTSRAMVYVLATVLALVGGAATVILLMKGPGTSSAAGLSPEQGTASPTTTAVVTAPTGPAVVPAPVTVTTEPTAAPTTTASATAAPSTTASAAPSTSTGTKKWTPTKTKKADPLDRR